LELELEVDPGIEEKEGKELADGENGRARSREKSPEGSWGWGYA
jgi:hypothetical protein